ncbi:MAG: hypothetical protein ACOYK8_08925 [Alphaproteobacteria bacterium]
MPAPPPSDSDGLLDGIDLDEARPLSGLRSPFAPPSKDLPIAEDTGNKAVEEPLPALTGLRSPFGNNPSATAAPRANSGLPPTQIHEDSSDTLINAASTVKPLTLKNVGGGDRLQQLKATQAQAARATEDETALQGKASAKPKLSTQSANSPLQPKQKRKLNTQEQLVNQSANGAAALYGAYMVMERTGYISKSVLIIIGLMLAMMIWGYAIYGGFEPPPIRYPDGVVVATEPEQKKLSALQNFMIGKNSINALASFNFKARFLGLKTYHDELTPIAPFDILIGWKVFSNQNVLDKIPFVMANRSYVWDSSSTPLNLMPSIVPSTALIHVIPADQNIKLQILELQRGQQVQMEGFLVNIAMENGTKFPTSLSRFDTGPTSAEIMLVQRVIPIAPPVEK